MTSLLKSDPFNKLQAAAGAARGEKREKVLEELSHWQRVGRRAYLQRCTFFLLKVNGGLAY